MPASDGANDKFDSVSSVSGKEFGQRLARTLPVIILAVILGFALHKSGWLTIFENATLDFASRYRQITPRQIADHIFIVEIDNNDYADPFGRKSPLDPDKLSEILRQIASGNPRIIVIDVGTENSVFKSLESPKGFQGSVIWGQTWKPVDSAETARLVGALSPEAIPLLPLCRRVVLLPAQVLGGSNETGLKKGLAYLPADNDGTVRRYCRQLQVLSGDRIVMEDSLPWRVAKEFDQGLIKKESEEANDVFIAFAQEPSKLPRMSAGELAQAYKGTGWKDLVEDKIVILGGTFDEARDVYNTRGGRIHGVKLLAQIIATELEIGGIRAVSDGWLIFSQFALSLVFAAINIKFARTWVPIAGLIAIPIVAVAGSSIALSNFTMWANFVPALFVVQLYALYEHIQEVHRKNVELKVINKELLQTRKTLARGVDEFGQEERKRLSATLHDETMMDLFQIETALSPLRKLDSGTSIYEKAYERLQQTRKNVRATMENLFPSVLKNSGLKDAINTMCGNLSTEQLVIRFEDHTDEEARRLTEPDQYRIYRIAQNALRNAIQHSEAQEILVELATVATPSQPSPELVLSISDNGKGFDGSRTRTGSQGLPNMRANADMLDANLQWITPSKFGKGTEVRLSVPLPAVVDGTPAPAVDATEPPAAPQ